MRAEQASERINGIFASGARLAGFYTFLTNNPHISFWNGVQIYAERPSVTVCKSFDDWHDQDNRRIKRGEHGIVYYDENRPNRRAYVFDISQTYGSERFHGVQHKMRESQLRDCINRQNVLFGVPRGNESEVYAAVYRYCQEHIADGDTEEYTEEYLACLTEGVTQCLTTYTGNKGVDVAPLPFDDDTNFRLCMEVLEISEGLREVIIEDEQVREEMSQRSSDMDLKCEYIGEMRGGDKGVVFATGTPISNSLVEMYTLQTYLQRNGLREVDLQFFDSWAALYTETITALELAPSGQGYRTRTRVAKFTNLPELLKMYRSFADVKTADMLNLPVPKVNKEVVEIEPTDKILELNADIVKRSEAISNGAVEPWEDNMLCVTHDGKMIALDPRCFDKTIPDDSNSKINRCVDNIYTIWKATEDKRCTQVVFCDMSTPKKMYADYNPEQDFDVYNDIKRKLIECGIPEEEIAYIHEAKTDQQKQDIFDRVRNGDIRVFLGSTEKCGAGTNFQNKLIALHHLDTPYRPSDLEQREGRIVRQGNENETVALFTYVTKRTFDAYSYQILETKQRFISQINRGDLSVRVAEDIDDATLTFAEIKAITSDNPKIKRKMEIEMRLGQLNDLEKIYRDNRYALQTQILHAPEMLQDIDAQMAVYQNDLELRKEHENDLIQIGKNKFEERKDAGSLLIRVVTSGEYVGKTVGYIKGFAIVPLPKSSVGHSVKLIGHANYPVYISESEVGTITRLENCLSGIDERIEECRQKKENYAKNLSVAKEQVDKPFEQAEEAEQLRNELAEIDAELDLGKQEAPIIMDEDTTDKPVVEILDEDDDEDEAEVA